MKAVFFDLDGTLLNLNLDTFLPRYFSGLSNKVAHLVDGDMFHANLMKATKAMINNTDPSQTNEEVFDAVFFDHKSFQRDVMYPIFEDFYNNDFQELGHEYGPVPGSHALLNKAQEMGMDLVLATNPLFPLKAIEERMRWAGILDYPFAMITSYELMHACKPHREYYEEILTRLQLKPQECLMIGNDPLEDMVAGELGITTYLALDHVVQRDEELPSPHYAGLLKEATSLLTNSDSQKE